jgi:hypothetical protein
VGLPVHFLPETLDLGRACCIPARHTTQSRKIVFMGSPFGNEVIAAITAVLAETSISVDDRGDLAIEFKESFNKAGIPGYGRTMAAFANATGGYLVFGVKNEPRQIVGLKNDQFQTLDPALTTRNLNEYFEPALGWQSYSFEFAGASLGLIYVAESQDKPVICRKNKDNELREGAIYFRYQGTTQEIRPAELRALMEAERKKINDQWLATLGKIAQVGVAHVGILDLKSGEVSGTHGSFFVSEELLPKLQFIQEGRFVETGGAPTLRLLGDLQSVGAGVIRETQLMEVPRVIRGVNLIDAFLRGEAVQRPMEWVRAVCHEQSANFPVFYFLHLAGVSLRDAADEIKTVQARGVGLQQLLKVFREGRKVSKSKVGGETPKGRLRAQMKDAIETGNLSAEEAAQNLDCFLEVVPHLSPATTDLAFIRRLLLECAMSAYSTMPGLQATRFRIAVCHLDQQWFGDRANAASAIAH